ncbi:hypothetical protein [Streptomyces sp. NPDC087307]|uniref:hypothetical protein n=1 Tax=Streptomyces sp. NPDC087307 TaxID=3365782 RepID=UPI0037FB24C4
MHLTPLCPDCSTATERIEVAGEEVWRCTAPGCGRRTYGTGDENDDVDLPSYSEIDENGAVIIYHGTGEFDVEATAELAAQDGPDEDDPDEDDDLVDEEQPAPASENVLRAVRVPGAPGWGNGPPRWGRIPGVESAPAPEGASTVFTDSDDGVGLEPRRPRPGVGHDPLPPDAGPSPLGHG